VWLAAIWQHKGHALIFELRMRLIDPKHPFYRAKWRRYLVVAVPFSWAGVEWSAGNVLWAYLSAAIGGYLAWHLVLNWRSDSAE
jgi:hypothetical protein